MADPGTTEFRMPSLGADMDAGTLVAWHVTPGSHVKRGDVVAEVETQKGLVEVEIWETGVIDAIVVSPGSKVPVGAVLATLRTADTKAAPAAAKATPAPPAIPPPAVPPPAPAAPPAAPSTAAPRASPVRASPAARQLAREREVDLATVTGTGPHGVVTRGDVERAGPAHDAAPPPVAPSTAFDAGAMRRAIGAAMARSKREIPHYYLSAELDVSRALHFLDEENARRPLAERLVFAALLFKATALALGEVPELNGYWVDGGFQPKTGVNLGIAIALRGGGLVAPAIHGCEGLSLTELMRRLTDLVARARAGSLRSSEMTDPTITVTNLGDQGTDAVFGVIYPPQVAVVGFGRVRERPWADGGMLGVRPVMSATLAADHRVSDGHRGGRFLAVLTRRLAEPEGLR